MMSSSQMLASIRAKKKKMMEDHSDAVKLSGIPEDATDIELLKMKEMTDPMDENHPKDRDDEPSLSAEHSKEMAPEPHEEMSPDPHVMGEDGMDDEKQKKFMKIKSMMGRMK